MRNKFRREIKKAIKNQSTHGINMILMESSDEYDREKMYDLVKSSCEKLCVYSGNSPLFPVKHDSLDPVVAYTNEVNAGTMWTGLTQYSRRTIRVANEIANQLDHPVVKWFKDLFRKEKYYA